MKGYLFNRNQIEALYGFRILHTLSENDQFAQICEKIKFKIDLDTQSFVTKMENNEYIRSSFCSLFSDFARKENLISFLMKY